MKSNIAVLGIRGMKSAAVFALAAILALVTARADPVAYVGMLGGNFGTLDLGTGAFTLLGNSGQTLSGMGVAGGRLYGTSYAGTSGTLYSINRTNGSLDAVGVSSVSYDLFGSTTSGLYVIGHNDTNLYSVNPADGAVTLIGPTGLDIGLTRGFSAGASSLYCSVGTNLYLINTNTGEPTLIGSMGEVEMGAMVMEDGLLFGCQDPPGPSLEVAALDPVTGGASGIAGMHGSGVDYVWGLAPYALVAPPNLSINFITASNSVVVSWPNTGGYILQQNEDPSATAGWVASGYAVGSGPGGANSVVIQPPIGNLFFRLAYP